MGSLTFLTLMSLDGLMADADGDFGWAAPDEEVHAFVNDLARPVGTYLYGRRMYETMAPWQTMDDDPAAPAAVADFAELWRAADKVVYSTSLTAVTTPRTRLESRFDLDDVAAMRAAGDVAIGGPTLAAPAITAGLVEEWQLFVAPVVIGTGLEVFPPGARLDLTLVEQRRFGSGMAFLRYRRR